MLGAAPGIGLDDLAGADLARRVDHKYLLTLDRLHAIAGTLCASHRLLTVDGLAVFRYRSVYFDTPALTCYRAHQQGRRLRWKARTRLYADSGFCRFEVKLKTGRGDTDKHAIVIGSAEFGELPAQGCQLLGQVLADRYRLEPPQGLAPTLRVAHSRTTLVAHDGTARVTLDTDLTFAAASCPAARLHDGLVLIETKSRDGRSRADRLLHAAGVRPVSVSKYCVGIALTHPDQPAQPWRPMIRRYFAA
jgi:hypothetical protein